MSNYFCSNLDCDYTTNRQDNLKMEELKEMVKKDGGSVEVYGTTCPNCLKNSLVYSAI